MRKIYYAQKSTLLFSKSCPGYPGYSRRKSKQCDRSSLGIGKCLHCCYFQININNLGFPLACSGHVFHRIGCVKGSSCFMYDICSLCGISDPFTCFKARCKSTSVSLQKDLSRGFQTFPEVCCSNSIFLGRGQATSPLCHQLGPLHCLRISIFHIY